MMINADNPKLADFPSSGIPPVDRKTALRPSGRGDFARFVFTKKRLDQLPLPSSGRAYYYDQIQRGLELRVYPSGKRTFVLYRKVDGKPERLTIGPYPDLTIDQARIRVQELNTEIARGANPAHKKRALRQEATLGELFESFLENHAKVNKRTWKSDVSMFNLHLDRLRLNKLSSITQSDLRALHGRIGKRHPYQANRVIELVSSLFSKAREWGWEGSNPATGIKAFKEHKRKRFLDGDELPSFFQSVAEETNTTLRDFFLASLLTGARRSNVQSMEWSEIRWGRSVWEIPAHKAKAGEALDVVLVPLMLELLERRRKDPGADEVFVFPGDGKTGHLVEVKGAWARILKRASIEDCRMHDLRRTLGSWQALQGASLVIIGASLGHTSLAATQVYARLNADPVRASVTRAVNAMFEAAPAGLLPARSEDGGNG
jgi:integrase